MGKGKKRANTRSEVFLNENLLQWSCSDRKNLWILWCGVFLVQIDCDFEGIGDERRDSVWLIRWIGNN